MTRVPTAPEPTKADRRMADLVREVHDLGTLVRAMHSRLLEQVLDEVLIGRPESEQLNRPLVHLDEAATALEAFGQ